MLALLLPFAFMRPRLLPFLLLAALLLAASPVFAVDIHDTRLLSEPAVTSDRIAFAYANDLWVANLDGTGVRRLTSHPGVESGPKFSPDGSGSPSPGATKETRTSTSYRPRGSAAAADVASEE